jgi:hypothetical protein
MVDNPDVTFTQCSAAVWSLLEMNLGILCNSLAALKPFVRQHFPTLFSTNGWGSSGRKTDEGAGGGSGAYAKRGGKKSSRAWGHSYQLHSVGKGREGGEGGSVVDVGGEMGEGKGPGDRVVVVDQFSVEYGSARGNKGAMSLTTGTGGSTESILGGTPQYPAQRPV